MDQFHYAWVKFGLLCGLLIGSLAQNVFADILLRAPLSFNSQTATGSISPRRARKLFEETLAQPPVLASTRCADLIRNSDAPSSVDKFTEIEWNRTRITCLIFSQLMKAERATHLLFKIGLSDFARTSALSPQLLPKSALKDGPPKIKISPKVSAWIIRSSPKDSAPANRIEYHEIFRGHLSPRAPEEILFEADSQSESGNYSECQLVWVSLISGIIQVTRHSPIGRCG